MEDKCYQWVEEAEKLSELSPKDAAELFKEAALCFDRQGNRPKAAIHFTVAGQFFLDLNDKKNASELFGKAIIRNIISDDMEAAEILLKKAEEYEFDSFQFRLARDRFSKKFATLGEEELVEELVGLGAGEEGIEILDLENFGEFEEISTIEQVSEGSIFRDLIEQASSDDILPSMSEFVFKEDPALSADTEDISGDLIIESILKRSRQISLSPIESSVTAKTESGRSRVLKIRSRIRPTIDLAVTGLSPDLTLAGGLELPSRDVDELQLEAIDETSVEHDQEFLKVKARAGVVTPGDSDLARLESPRSRFGIEGVPVPDESAAEDLELSSTLDAPDLEDVSVDASERLNGIKKKEPVPLTVTSATIDPRSAIFTQQFPGEEFIPTDDELTSKLELIDSPLVDSSIFNVGDDSADVPGIAEIENILTTGLSISVEDAVKEGVERLPVSKKMAGVITDDVPINVEDIVKEEAEISPVSIETTDVIVGDTPEVTSSSVETVPPAAIPPLYDVTIPDLRGVPVLDLDNPVTLKPEFINESEIANEYNYDLEDVEIVDTVPFGWQIKEIKHEGFELVSKKAQLDEGVAYTWKKGSLKKGEKAKIEYVVVKRVQRSIVTKQENKFSLVNTHHSYSGLDTDAVSAKIDFTNTSDKPIEHLLIEDVIPPEFTIRAVDSGKWHPILMPTKDSVNVRWVIGNMAPGESLNAEYVLEKKQIASWYRRRFFYWTGGTVAVEKLIEPLNYSLSREYLLYLDITPKFDTYLEIIDQVPLGTTITFHSPLWLQPVEFSHQNNHFLSWQLDLKADEHIRILLRLKTDKQFNPGEPVVKFADLISQEDRERIVKRITEKIDLKERMVMRT
ncbi:MAG: hypothetical protein ACXAEU_00720 [Candidatus Hodarchaeales archaeon]|jgi:hypothetical protein